MTPSPTFMTEIRLQHEQAQREVAQALADKDDLGLMLAQGRLADLAEIVERHTDHSVPVSA